MALNLQNLTPEDQNALAQLFAKAQTSPAKAAPQMAGDQGAMQANELKPGSFRDNPQGAIEHIVNVLGPQLKAGPANSGYYTKSQPADDPIGKLFNMNVNTRVPSTNYANAVQKAGLTDFLPEGLPRLPNGQPLVSAAVSDQAKQLATLKQGDRKLSPEESKLTIAYWKEAAPSLVPMAEAILAKDGGLPEWLGKAGPSYRLKRSEYSSVQGFTEEGKPVEYDQTERKWYVGGKETPAGQIGRLMTKTRPQLDSSQINEVTNLLNAQNQLKEVETLFDPKAIGPVENKLLNFQEYTGIKVPDLQGLSVLTDEKVKLRTVMGSAINDYIKAITGAQMSEPEARRIMKALPKPGSADEAFLPALQEIMKVTKQKLNTRLDVLETQDTVGIRKLRDMANTNPDMHTGEPTVKPVSTKPKKSLDSIFGSK